MKRLPQAQRDAIATLREKDLSYKQIAMKLKIPEGTVTNVCLVDGIERPSKTTHYNAPLPPTAYTYTRNGKPVRGYTPEEDALLTALDQQGVKHSEIARRLNRQHNSIKGRLTILARRAERATNPSWNI